MKRATSILLGIVLLWLAGSAARMGHALGNLSKVPSPGTPGEVNGGDSTINPPAVAPLPNPPPEYRGREKTRLVRGDDERGMIDGGASPRFAFVDAYVDSKDRPLAAYQFELTAQGAGVTLVGVEGGDPPAYAEPPYYDPKANLRNRIVIGSFNTGDNLPRGRTRVARVMVRITGAADPVWSAKLDVAASPDVKPIDATISVSEGAAP